MRILLGTAEHEALKGVQAILYNLVAQFER